jgi:hypothetical protein
VKQITQAPFKPRSWRPSPCTASTTPKRDGGVPLNHLSSGRKHLRRGVAGDIFRCLPEGGLGAELWQDPASTGRLLRATGEPQGELANLVTVLELPSAHQRPIVVRAELDRSQPHYDRGEQESMAVVVGRVRECPVPDYKFVILGHNTVRGAAEGAILNAELLIVKGYLQT